MLVEKNMIGVPFWFVQVTILSMNFIGTKIFERLLHFFAQKINVKWNGVQNTRGFDLICITSLQEYLVKLAQQYKG